MSHRAAMSARPARKTLRPLAALLAAVAMTAPSNAGADWAAARDAFETGRYADAVAELELLAALHPEHTETQAFLGVARIHAGDAAGAIAPLEAATVDPDRPDFHLLLAWALILDGRLDRAIAHVEAVTDDLPASLARASDWLLAVAALRLSDPVRASRVLEAAADRESGAPEPWIALGILAVRRGDYSEAADAFERAADLAPDRDEIGQAALVAGRRARPGISSESMDEALRRTVERLEAQLAGPAEPSLHLVAGVISYGSPEDEEECTLPDDHRCIPGRLVRDPAGGLSRSAAPPD